MSTFNRNTLAIALVTALGFSTSAFAVTFGTGPTAFPGDQTPEKIATADVPLATTVITLADGWQVGVESTDLIIGRTQGLAARINLDNGAQFAAIPAVAAGAGLPAGWTVTVAAGGQINDTFVIYSFNPPSLAPPAVVPGLTVGQLLNVTGVQLKNLTALQTSGAIVNASIGFSDPGTAQPILVPRVTPILQSGNPLVVACDATTGELAERIDVGVTPTQGSKTAFSSTGAIGVADNGRFNAGTVTAAVAAGFTFAYAGTDAFKTEVAGTYSAFKGAETAPGSGIFASSTFLASDALCTTSLVAGTTNAAADKLTFNYTGATVGITPTGFSAFLCFSVPFPGGTKQIDASVTNVTTTFTRGSFVAVAPVCPLLPLQFNGSVVKVFTFNPAGNTTQESFARITNWGNTGGKVTIQGWDDNGAPATGGSVSFTLAAGKSLQLNSSDLESGNTGKGLTGALGDGAGKWRLIVTGEFDGMDVTSLNRNNTTGTLTNLTDADNRGEQVGDGK